MYPRPLVSRFRTRRAFTLIELLTVIAIIGILAAIIVPTVSKVRNTAKKAQCVARIRQWGTAVNLCANDYKSNIALFFKADTFTYGDYMTGKNMMVEASTGTISNRAVLDAMSICPTGINGDNSLNSVKQYAFVVPVGVSEKNAKVFGVSGNQYFYKASDAATPAKLLLMVEVANMTVVKTPAIGDIKTAIEADNSIRKMQTKETYIRHGGTAHALFLDGHVGGLNTADTDYTQSKDLLDRYFSLK